MIVQLGGQTPLKLAAALEEAGIPILGTSPDAIDLAEDRERFQELLHGNWTCASQLTACDQRGSSSVAEKIGYPVLCALLRAWAARRWKSVHDDALDRTCAKRMVVRIWR